MKNRNQEGQALILLLLILAVALTVTFSAVSRSVTEIKVSSTEEESLRAFSAAEAGIEHKLLNPQVSAPSPFTIDNTTSYTVGVSSNRETDRSFKYPKDLASGETATFWFVSHDNASGRLTCTGSGKSCYRGPRISVCWGREPEPPQATAPAIEVSIFYDDGSSPTQSVANPNNFSNVKVARSAFDRYALARGNNFNSTNVTVTEPCIIDGQEFLYKVDNVIPAGFDPNCQAVDGCLLMAVVRMLYNNIPQPVGLQALGGPNNLPAQGLLVESIGTSGQSKRKVNVFQSYPEIPNLFEASVYSRSGLNK